MIKLSKLIQIMQKLIIVKVRDLILFLGIALSRLRKFVEAIKMLDYSLYINPNHANAYIIKGRDLDLYIRTCTNVIRKI